MCGKEGAVAEMITNFYYKTNMILLSNQCGKSYNDGAQGGPN